MSTNSTNQFSVEDDGSVTESPPQSTKKCTRNNPCLKSDCNSCAEPEINSHIRDLSNDMEGARIKPTIPPNHWIIDITNAFKEAIQDQDPIELKMVRDLYQRHMNAVTAEDTRYDTRYDRTEIKQINRNPNELLATFSTTPIQPAPPPPNRQTASNWTN